MRVIIAGSRTAARQDVLKAIGSCPWSNQIKTVISGGALGADLFGETWAKDNEKPFIRFPADWAKHGKAAGPIRNREMAKNADALIAVWDGKSKGTKNMINEAKAHGLAVYTYEIGETK